MKYRILTAFLTLSVLISYPNNAIASDIPSFPLCVNPLGELKASYDHGTHGIVGDRNTYTGSDKVYQVNDRQILQCFCAEDGTGIQTNWLKVQDISETEKKQYEKEGWIYVPNGKKWGLEESAYVAKNISYTCKGADGKGGSTTDTHILGFAATGDITTTLGFFFGGLTALLLGLTLRKRV